jgi:trehalose/maltose transport system substrate-binding protein
LKTLTLSRRVHRGIETARFLRLSCFWLVPTAVGLALVLAPTGCRRSVGEPVTVTFFDPEGLHDLGERRVVSDAALQDFTRETGIRVNHLPAPESNHDQLILATELLQKGVGAPDVYGVDVIWSWALSPYLIDLKPYFAAAVAAEDPAVLTSYTVQGRLVAMPYHPNIGVLIYRADLLVRYGYRAPPKTWDELEAMAVRIQRGERERGMKDFWGFVWPGGASEALTCNALEWQVDAGGGRILEDDRKISVNNPEAIHAWERAARWVGWISPPSVTSYQEWDASNAFWVSGNAAFSRGWSDYFLDHSPDVPFRDQAGVTSVPGGRSARVAMLGGFGLGVANASAHRAEAIRLVQFLIRREARIEAARSHEAPPLRPELFELPAILLKAYPRLARPGELPGAEIVARPSASAGSKYEDVSQAYIAAVHSVLTGTSSAPAAAAALEAELVRITGLETGRK